MEQEYTELEDIEAVEDMELLEEDFDELENYFDRISQLRMNEEE